ncbi:MAG TPA: AzlD family protein [Bordetella sp.]|nr:AzlD family protein [Bordetella sp.]
MVDPANLLAIVLMATVTYLTRIGGYILLRKRSLGPRAMAVLEAAPGCVLISVIAPAFVSDQPSDLVALALTVIAATRLPLLPTVIIGVGSAALLRHLYT